MLARCVSINALFLLSASLAQAQPERERAFELFERAEAEYAGGDLEEAERLLAEALSIFHEPALVYNLARARERLGRTEEAIAGYRAYLEEVPDAPNRGVIERQIETLERSLRTPEREPEPEPAPERRPPVESDPPLVIPLVFGGVGLAALGTGAVLGGLAVAERDAAIEAPSQRDGMAALDRGETLATVANVLFSAGGAVLAVGVVWAIVALAAAGDESVALDRGAIVF
jgi:tetratricopeptide (TPR) repeat protein